MKRIIRFCFLFFLTISIFMILFNYDSTPENTYSISTNQIIFKADAPIQINGDSELSLIASAGNGSQSNPYLIENYMINGTGLNSHGILIGNTTAYFKIKNCIIQEVDSSYSGIVLKNLTNGGIQASTINNSNFGIYLYKTNDTTVNDNKVNDNEYGIYLEDSNLLEILRNNLSNHYYHGIYILNTNNSHVHGNIAYNSYHSGIGLSGWHNNITENTAYHSKMGWLNPNGLYAVGAHYNNIDGNNFSNNIDYGITVSSSTYNNFSNNLIKDNGAPSEYIEDGGGIRMGGSNNNFFNNTLINNEVAGFEISSGLDNKIINNTIINNSNQGIFYYGNPGKTHVHNNTFIQNGIVFDIYTFEDYEQNITPDNTIGGLPIIYYRHQNNMKISGNFGQLILFNCSYSNITDSTFSSWSRGVALHYSDFNQIINNNLNTVPLNDLAKSRSCGIFLSDSTDNKIINNTASNTYNGILVYPDSDRTDIINNTANNNIFAGIGVWDSGSVLIKNNTANSNENYGIRLVQGDNIPTWNNSLYNNGIAGINLEQSYGLIWNNTISNSSNGFLVTNCPTWSEYRNNTLIDTGYAGFNFGSGAARNRIYNNHFFNCGIIFEAIDSADQNITTDNTINSLPIKYYKHQRNQTYSGNVGQLILYNCSGSKITNCNPKSGSYGISLYLSHDNEMFENNIDVDNYYGIYTYQSDSNTILNNSAINLYAGIKLKYSDYNNISVNNFSNNKLYGVELDHSFSNRIYNNTANLNNQSGLYLDYSNKNFIINNSLNYANNSGIHLEDSDNNTLGNNTVSNNADYGINLLFSDLNNLSYNIANYNGETGIKLDISYNNSLSNNTANYNTKFGIYLTSSDYNNLTFNYINNNDDSGIKIYYSDYNRIYNNIINNNYNYGIHLDASDYTTILMNTMIDNLICFYQEDDCYGTLYGYNICQNRTTTTPPIPGFSMLIGIIILIIILFLFMFLKENQFKIEEILTQMKEL